jgi:hypothetical protein
MCKLTTGYGSGQHFEASVLKWAKDKLYLMRWCCATPH